MIRLGLIGHPVTQSLSPEIHRTALTACGVQGDYTLFRVAPNEPPVLHGLLDRMRGGDIQGLNVTIPHKRTIVALLDALTPTATAVGAVNTIFREGGNLVGDNTDVEGFRCALERFLHTHGRQAAASGAALVLGAGGAARAAVYALATSGWKVTVVARRVAQAYQLARDLAESDVHVVDRAELPNAVSDRLAACALIVNATPVGTPPRTDESPWPADLPFPQHAAVYDLVYVPSVTRLVHDARAAGLPAATGLGMLIEQALLSFERWTGCTPPRDAIDTAVRHQLEVVPCSDS
jgi:shikimate dehydrogenase